jgi:putative endonuclease
LVGGSSPSRGAISTRKGYHQENDGYPFLAQGLSARRVNHGVEMALSLARACFEAVERLIEGLVEGPLPYYRGGANHMSAWLYILRLKSGILYIGATTDLDRRCREHFEGKACRTTKLDPPIELIYSEEFPTFAGARRREAHVKRWSRAKKEALVSGEFAKLRELSLSHENK